MSRPLARTLARQARPSGKTPSNLSQRLARGKAQSTWAICAAARAPRAPARLARRTRALSTPPGGFDHLGTAPLRLAVPTSGRLYPDPISALGLDGGGPPDSPMPTPVAMAHPDVAVPDALVYPDPATALAARYREAEEDVPLAA